MRRVLAAFLIIVLLVLAVVVFFTFFRQQPDGGQGGQPVADGNGDNNSRPVAANGFPVVLAELATITPEAVGQGWLTKLHTLPGRVPARPSLAISPDSTLLAVGGDGQVSFSHLPTLAPEDRTYECNRWCAVAFHPNSNPVRVAVGNRLYEYDNRTDRTFPLAPNHEATAVAFSPDGNLIAVASRDQDSAEIRIFGLADEDDEPRWTLPVMAGPVTSLAFAPDNHLLAAGLQMQQIGLWHVADACLQPGGCQVGIFPAGASVHSVSFAVDGFTTLLAGGQSLHRVQPSPSPINPPMISGMVDFSPDGRLLAVVDAYEVKLYPPWTTPNAFHALDLIRFDPNLKGERPAVQFSPNGQLLVVAGMLESKDEPVVEVWGVPAVQPYKTLHLAGPIAPGVKRSVAFGSRGDWLAQTDGQTVKVWDMPDHRPGSGLLLSETPFQGLVTHLYVNPSDGTLVILESVGAGHTVYRHRVRETLSPQVYHEPLLKIDNMAFGSSTTEAVTRDVVAALVRRNGNERGIQFWDWHTWQRQDWVSLKEHDAVAIGFNQEAQTLEMAAVNGTLHAWSLDDAYVSYQQQFGEPAGDNAYHLAAAAPNGTFVFLNRESAGLRKANDHTFHNTRSPLEEQQTNAAFSGNGQLAAVVTACNVWIWRLNENDTDTLVTILRPLRDDCLHDVAFHPERPQFLATMAASGKLQLWEVGALAASGSGN